MRRTRARGGEGLGIYGRAAVTFNGARTVELTGLQEFFS